MNKLGEHSKSYILRNLLYRAGMCVTLVLITLFTFSIGLLMPNKRRTRIITRWNLFNSTWWLWFCLNIKVEVSGTENVPNEPFVAMCNHQSEWETLYLGYALLPLCIVIKRSLLLIPFFGWLLWICKSISIDRKAMRDATKHINKMGQQRIAEGYSVLVFPEGSRWPSDRIKPYKRTAAKLAIDAGCQVVPIVHDSGKCCGDGIWFKPGTIHIHMGEPINSSEHDALTLTQNVQQWAESWHDSWQDSTSTN